MDRELVFTDIGKLQRRMDRMDDSEQRRFMRQLTMETHVTLNQHLEDEKPVKKQIEDMHAALFHPTNGLVNVKKWMCRIATWTATITTGLIAAAAGVASFGHSVGWW